MKVFTAKTKKIYYNIFIYNIYMYMYICTYVYTIIVIMLTYIND